ncbi:pyruvate kinase [Leuconostoc sp. MS02]|uniref:Pyruvate kinase n=1 Tax=Leuconostoc aquikimchii TaxID=3236804 RepID=A0ABV3S562_9LACO
MAHIDALRINLSKYDSQELLSVVDIISDYTKLYPEHYPIYFDLPFPKNKTRISDFNVDNNCVLKSKIYTIVKNQTNLLSNQLSLNANKFQHVQNTLFYGDGEGSFTVIKKSENEIEVVANNTFKIKKGKSILIGFVQTSEWDSIIRKLGDTFYDVTYLLSFVEKASDILNFKASLNNNSCRVIPKFETPDSVDNSQEILEVSEGAFIARGDLAFTIPTDRLLNAVERITQQVKSGKELIFATDILTSLDHQMFPNRADLFDFLYIQNLNATGIVFGGIKNFFYDKIDSEIVNTLNRKTQFVKER